METDEYALVNAVWPHYMPPITRVEAQRAALKLSRHFRGKQSIDRLRARRTGWVRRCWIAQSPPYNQIHRGWRRLVHDVSHAVYRATYRNVVRNHGGAHARLELAMTEYVLDQGWLAGTLRSKVRTVVPTERRRELAVVGAQSALRTWERKLKLAQTKVKKYRAKVRRYERRLTAVFVPTEEDTK